eukprot:TRINITY_DN28388_c0_g1_i1.p1 TRINITY_DN28388_c0_g1~~TRINITY_DN28388_c0_g1_i1.p1  ORF type:complete len:671 (+),score=199.89 TRINITY_DN28388_c0_g1_i1:68-2014(+)
MVLAGRHQARNGPLSPLSPEAAGPGKSLRQSKRGPKRPSRCGDELCESLSASHRGSPGMNGRMLESPPVGDDASPGPAVGSPLDSKNLMALLETFSGDVQGDDDALDPAEMEMFWQKVFPDMRRKDVKDFTDGLFSDIDINGDGQVTLDELRSYLESLRVGDDGIEQGLGFAMYKSRPDSWQQWVWAVVEPGGTTYLDVPWLPAAGKVAAAVSQTAIATSVVTIVVETLPQMQNQDGPPGNGFTFAIESICIGIFTVEFLLRSVTTPSRKEYWLSFFTWVDIVSILPYYLVLWGVVPENSGTGALVALRVVRVMRLIRLFKFGRHFKGIQLLFTALVDAADALLASMLVFNMIGIIIWASLIHMAERTDAEFDFTGSLGYKDKWVRNKNMSHVYDDAGTPIDFQTIPVSMWWAWVTLTTVGYGDMYPRTDWGRFVASLAMVSGLLVVAYPVTMLMSSLEFAREDYRVLKGRRHRQKLLVQKLHQGSIIVAGEAGKSQRPPTPTLSVASCPRPRADSIASVASADGRGQGSRTSPHRATAEDRRQIAKLSKQMERLLAAVADLSDRQAVMQHQIALLATHTLGSELGQSQALSATMAAPRPSLAEGLRVSPLGLHDVPLERSLRRESMESDDSARPSGSQRSPPSTSPY